MEILSANINTDIYLNTIQHHFLDYCNGIGKVILPIRLLVIGERRADSRLKEEENRGRRTRRR